MPQCFWIKFPSHWEKKLLPVEPESWLNFDSLNLGQRLTNWMRLPSQNQLPPLLSLGEGTFAVLDGWDHFGSCLGHERPELWSLNLWILLCPYWYCLQAIAYPLLLRGALAAISRDAWRSPASHRVISFFPETLRVSRYKLKAQQMQLSCGTRSVSSLRYSRFPRGRSIRFVPTLSL